MKIAIVIPTKGKVDLLKSCLESIYSTQTMPYHIFVADTGSTVEELQQMWSFLIEVGKNNKNITLLQYEYYNFSKINNHVVRNYIDDSYSWVLFCNNDIVLNHDIFNFIREQNLDNVGTVGFKLKFKNGLIQHAGQYIEFDKNNVVGLGHIGYSRNDDFRGVAHTTGNTFACAATPLKLFREIGGLNEKYIECFEDVEYNLQCLIRGKENIIDLDADIIHHESLTRNNDETKYSKMRADYDNVLRPFIDKNIDKNHHIIPTAK
jgi:GT2 family glycosyltransferase